MNSTARMTDSLSISPSSDSLQALAARIATGTLNARQLLDQAQEAALQHAALNALAAVDWTAAARAADLLDAQVRAGHLRGRLHGLPLTIKDLYPVDGLPTAAGTRAALPATLGPEATAVTLLRRAGALPFAKTQMHEIALGATGENPWTGDVKNPFDPAHQAGGSSSGAAVATAVGIGLAALGSDTGGSVRIPAAFCGVVGFKPSFGAIPLTGALPLSWTCDHAGPITRSVADAALLFEVMSGRRTDHGAVPRRPRLAVPATWLKGRLEPAVREAFEALRTYLAPQADLVEVEVPALLGALDAYTAVVRAEAAFVHRVALEAGGVGFSESVLAPMRDGATQNTGRYLAALAHRDRLRTALEQVLRDHDALILPTTAVRPPLRGQMEVSVEGGTLSTREAVLGQTLPFSFTGLPTLALPMGVREGLPLSLQVVGAPDADATVLALGRWLESRIAG